MKVIGLIPARSGSKGIKNKNFYPLNGKPLIQYTIDFANQCTFFNDVYISTDLRKYEKYAVKEGINSFGLRSKRTASDRARMQDVVREFIKSLDEVFQENYIIILLQPTSPLRNTNDRKKVKSIIEQISEYASWVSCQKVGEPHPYKTFKIVENAIDPLFDYYSLSSPRQLLPETYMFDGAFYIFSRKFFEDNDNFLGRKSNVFVSDGVKVNIDTEEDLILTEYYLKQRHEN